MQCMSGLGPYEWPGTLLWPALAPYGWLARNNQTYGTTHYGSFGYIARYSGGNKGYVWSLQVVCHLFGYSFQFLFHSGFQWFQLRCGGYSSTGLICTFCICCTKLIEAGTGAGKGAGAGAGKGAGAGAGAGKGAGHSVSINQAVAA